MKERKKKKRSKTKSRGGKIYMKKVKNKEANQN